MIDELRTRLGQRALSGAVQDGIVIADEVALWPEDALPSLLADGTLREIQLASSVECDGCYEGHVEPVQVVEEPHGSLLRHYIVCPEVGRVPVDPQRLRRWEIVVAAEARGDEQRSRAETPCCGLEHSDEFRWVRLGDREFSFSNRQAETVKVLHDSACAGKPELSWPAIATKLTSPPASMSQVFKRKSHWTELVLKTGRGLYRLNMPAT